SLSARSLHFLRPSPPPPPPPSFPTRRSSDLLMFFPYFLYGNLAAQRLPDYIRIDLTQVRRNIAANNQFHSALGTPDIFHQIAARSEEHTSELQSRFDLVCRVLLEKKKK